jgi:hypothetical protein
MARRSLRPQLNQIRLWVQQGRTDAWIAHQLEVTTQQIDAFKRENDLAPAGSTEAANGGAAADFDDEIDLRAQDDELIAAELEQAEAERAAREAEEAERKAAEAERRAAEGGDDEDEVEEEKPKRTRGRRGGAGRGRSRAKRKPGEPLEATFDHGEEGYGLWLDPAVADDPVYAEHWAGHRPVTVVIEDDQIVIRRTGDSDGESDDD